jgi:hypothetical protein
LLYLPDMLRMTGVRTLWAKADAVRIAEQHHPAAPTLLRRSIALPRRTLPCPPMPRLCSSSARTTTTWHLRSARVFILLGEPRATRSSYTSTPKVATVSV